MKPLPILSNINQLPFGIATQVRMGEFITADNDFPLSGYAETGIQFSFRVNHEKVLVAYFMGKYGEYFDVMTNVTQLYNIVKSHFGCQFNVPNVKKTLNAFADVYKEAEKNALLALCFKEIEGEIMLSKRFPTFICNSLEHGIATVVGMIVGSSKSIYEDVVMSLNLSNDKREYIYDVLSSINSAFPES